jgi:hypothetical protein
MFTQVQGIKKQHKIESNICRFPQAIYHHFLAEKKLIHFVRNVAADRGKISEQVRRGIDGAELFKLTSARYAIAL